MSADVRIILWLIRMKLCISEQSCDQSLHFFLTTEALAVAYFLRMTAL